MQVTHDVVLRNIPEDMRDRVQATILGRIEALETYCDRITACRVVVEPSASRHRLGNLFHVRVDLNLPGGEIVVRRDPPRHQAHQDVYVAIHDAFDAVRRQLEDHVRRRFQRKVKEHAVPPHGTVVELLPGQDHGFLRTPGGELVYFHRNAVPHGGFDRLRPGQAVRYVPSEGREGPQASTVEPLGRHHGLAP